MREEALLRKLIADGEGVGDERKIQQLNAFFRDARKGGEVKFIEAQKTIKALDTLEISLMKQMKVSTMNREQADEFVNLAENIEQEIEETNRKMAEAKKELVEARIVKKNRQEYSTVVKKIDEVPSRSETTRKLAELRDELERHQERQRILENKLIDRKNHLHAFNIILANFQRLVTEDEDTVGDDDDDEETSSVKEKPESLTPNDQMET